MGGKETIKKKLQNAYSNCLSEALTSWSQTWRSLRWLPWSDELGEGVAEVHFPSHADFALIFPFLHFLASAVIAYIKNFTDYNCYNERGMIYNPIMACNALTRRKKNEGKKKKRERKDARAMYKCYTISWGETENPCSLQTVNTSCRQKHTLWNRGQKKGGIGQQQDIV